MAESDLRVELAMARSAAPRDLFRSWWTVLLLWGAPIALGASANAAYAFGWPLRDAYAVWIGATVWFGLACLANAWGCGRVHCWIDGVGMPSLAALGALSLGGIFPLSLNQYGFGFWAILVASFCVEGCWKTYL